MRVLIPVLCTVVFSFLLPSVYCSFIDDFIRQTSIFGQVRQVIDDASGVKNNNISTHLNMSKSEFSLKSEIIEKALILATQNQKNVTQDQLNQSVTTLNESLSIIPQISTEIVEAAILENSTFFIIEESETFLSWLEGNWREFL